LSLETIYSFFSFLKNTASFFTSLSLLDALPISRVGTEQHWYGVLDHDGRPNRRLRGLGELAQELGRIGALLAGTDAPELLRQLADRKSTRLNSSHVANAYAVCCSQKTSKLQTNY